MAPPTHKRRFKAAALAFREDNKGGAVVKRIGEQLDEISAVDIWLRSIYIYDGRDGRDGLRVGEEHPHLTPDQNTSGQPSVARGAWKVAGGTSRVGVVAGLNSARGGSNIGCTSEKVEESKVGSGGECERNDQRVGVHRGNAVHIIAIREMKQESEVLEVTIPHLLVYVR